MKTTTIWTLIALAPAVLAQGLRQATGGDEPTSVVQWYPTPTPEVSNCTANLITTICDYKEPGSAFAVASSGKAHCWEYCNSHQPCNFVIFAAGNPYTGDGTCWLYPDEQFDKNAGKEGCDFLSVYDKPTCAQPTPTVGACTATASPSAVASICDYPTPDDNCWSTCSPVKARQTVCHSAQSPSLATMSSSTRAMRISRRSPLGPAGCIRMARMMLQKQVLAVESLSSTCIRTRARSRLLCRQLQDLLLRLPQPQHELPQALMSTLSRSREA
jgi:hypothetical protein